MKEEYLGDGLYASFDGYMVTLRAPREEGNHWVGLEPPILVNFVKFAVATYGYDFVSRIVGSLKPPSSPA